MTSWGDQEHTMEAGNQERHKDPLVTKDCKFSVQHTRGMVTPGLPASGMPTPHRPTYLVNKKKKIWPCGQDLSRPAQGVAKKGTKIE